jgi:hypothetical protein
VAEGGDDGVAAGHLGDVPVRSAERDHLFHEELPRSAAIRAARHAERASGGHQRQDQLIVSIMMVLISVSAGSATA